MDELLFVYACQMELLEKQLYIINQRFTKLCHHTNIGLETCEECDTLFACDEMILSCSNCGAYDKKCNDCAHNELLCDMCTDWFCKDCAIIGYSVTIHGNYYTCVRCLRESTA